MTIEALDRIPWFARQRPALRERIGAAGRVVALRRGQWVYSQGDEGTGLCAVLDGALRLEVATGGDRDVLIGLAQAGAMLGQARRYGGGPRIITVRASGAARVWLVSDEALAGLAADAPELWRAVGELVYAQLEAATRLSAQLLVQTPRQRVAARVLQFAVEDVVSVNQSDLAEMCGLSRKTANAHLAALEASGAITRGYRTIMVRDPDALRRV